MVEQEGMEVVAWNLDVDEGNVAKRDVEVEVEEEDEEVEEGDVEMHNKRNQRLMF